MEMAGLKKWIRPAMRALPSKRSLFIGFLALIAFLLIAIPLFNRWMYPIKYEEQIFNSAEATGADPFLVMAVIRTESKFDPDKESPKGAMGLMQLMPDTVDEIVERGPFSPAYREHPFDPGMNIHMGSWYLAALKREYKDNEVAAVAAYNAGAGNVNKWLREGTWDGSRRNVSNIPFGETRHYIQRVFFYYDKYKSLYGHLEDETRRK